MTSELVTFLKIQNAIALEKSLIKLKILINTYFAFCLYDTVSSVCNDITDDEIGARGNCNSNGQRTWQA